MNEDDKNIYTNANEKIMSLVSDEEKLYGSNKFLDEFSDWFLKELEQKEHFFLYRYCSADCKLLDSIRRGYIYLVPNQMLNDCYEGIAGEEMDGKIVNEEYMKKNIKDVAHMRCFTVTNNNMAMWGKYADESKGVCIQYDLMKLEKVHREYICKHLFPVIYREERNFESGMDMLELSEYTNIIQKFRKNKKEPFEKEMDNLECFRQMFIFKGSDWKYEKEWRLVFTPMDEIELIDHDEKKYINENELVFDCVSKMYFGDRIGIAEKNEIIELAKIKKITYIQAKFSDWNFKYKLEE